MDNLKVDSEALREAARQINEKVEELDSKVSQLGNVCEQIRDSWYGNASESYVEKVEKKKVELSSIVEELAKLPTVFNNIASQMDETENSILSKIGGSN